MAEEQLYQFVDKSGKCFESFQDMGDNKFDKRYHDYIGAALRASHHGEHFFIVGDMLVFRDELVEAGFKWGIDFYVRKVDGK